ncbi:MAG: response regulator [Planctomycetota bacterium]|nr:MAG: response regulator [Planctomycetota bacterium]
MALILIIDDQPESCELVQEILEDGGHQVLTATSWIDGTSQIHRHHPDLILIDVQMPQLRGPQGLQLLRQFTNRKLPKMVFLSAMDEGELHKLTKLHAADGYIQKGNLTGILEKIEEILSSSDDENSEPL